jgi:protein-S-isoprenylcysteine O-methyltransferase Ste14
MTVQRLLVRVPPPLLFAATFVAGALVERACPIWASSGEAAPAIAGLVLIAAGALLVLGSLGLFARTRTTIVPHRRPRHLVTSGPYRVTRNPMYVAVTTIYVGVALRLGLVWPLFLLPLPLAILQKLVIPMEEENLRATFGDEYAEYCRRVRRWL